MELVSPMTGERLVFRQTHASSGGALLQAEITMQPGHHVIPFHVHPRQQERFEVLEGTLGIYVGRALRIAGTKEDVVVPVRVPHSYWNAGPGPLRVLYEHRPALPSAEAFLIAYYRLSREGKLDRRGQIGLWQAAVMMPEVGGFIRPARPPLPVQDLLFPVMAAVGRRLGHRPW